MKSSLGRGWLRGLEIRGGREKNLAFKGELTIWVYVAKRNGCGNGHFPSEMGIHKGKKEDLKLIFDFCPPLGIPIQFFSKLSQGSFPLPPPPKSSPILPAQSI